MEIYPEYYHKLPQEPEVKKTTLQRYASILRLANYDVYRIIKNSIDVNSARTMLILYLSNCEMAVESAEAELRPLEIALIRDCINTFRNMLKPRSEMLAGFSVLDCLWNLFNRHETETNSRLSRSFVEDMRHLLIGIAGRARIYSGKDAPDFLKLEGRMAAEARTKDLDGLSDYALSYVRRYPSGLESEVKQTRKENVQRILKFFKATEQDWQDYQWHLRHIIRNASTLGQLVTLTPQEAEAIEQATAQEVPFAVTPYYASLMDYEPHRKFDHAIRAQVIPPLDYVGKIVEGRMMGLESLDFMLEQDTSPIDGIVRRYPMIVILKPYNACSQICVYCQRNWEIKQALAPDAMLGQEKLEEALAWLEQHPAVNEVLITGGDPLILSDSFLDKLLSRLAHMNHIERIRLGSRLPVVLPQRVTTELVDIISKYQVPARREITLVTHFEHVYEITPDAVEAVQRFRQKGIPIYNQLVYTVETSRRFESCALRRLLRLIGVFPYYTFNTKGKEETDRYRLPIARLIQEQKEEARVFPGMVRTDEAVYNIPRLGKNYLRAAQHHSVISILPDGRRVYEFHPWEKKIALVDTYITQDVPIYKYLKELERRGETIRDYQSIWYYY